jgi:hypothetical protein
MIFDYFLSTESNTTLFYGRTNTIFVESEFLENEEINFGVDIKPIRNCITKGIYPIVEIIPTGKPICTIEIYYKNELKKVKHFVVIDLPNPYLTADCLRDYSNDLSNAYDEILGSNIKLNDFKSIKKIEATIIKDGAGASCLRFEIVHFDFSILRDNRIIFHQKNIGNMLNDKIEEFKSSLEVGDKILFSNINCRIGEYENEKAIEKFYNYNMIEIK